jgi:hypothetical protein
VKVGWDRKSVSVHAQLPEPDSRRPSALNQVEATLAPLAYDRIYGAWPGHHVVEGAQRCEGNRLSAIALRFGA